MFLREKKDVLWFWLLVLLYIGFLIPTLDVQPCLSAGDNGRDLYAYQMMLQGKWPGRDFFYQYSPLMPLYYAFWFLLGGVHLMSLRIGLGVLLLTCGLLTFRTLRIFVSAPIAFLASLAFLSVDIIHTFNHIGAFPLFMISIFSLWKFFLTRRVRWCYFGTLAIAGIALVKWSMGACVFMAFFASLAFHNLLLKKRQPDPQAPLTAGHFVYLSLIFGALVFGTYAPLYLGLPLNWLIQGLGGTFWYYSLWAKLVHIPMRFLFWEPRRLWWLGGFLTFGIFALLGLIKRRQRIIDERLLPSILVSLVLFGLASSTDYFLMEGYFHRLDFWCFPIFVLLMALFTEWGSALFNRKMKMFFGTLIFLGLIWVPVRNIQDAFAWRIPERYLNFPQGKVYLGGNLTEVKVIRRGAHFIIGHTKPLDEILVIPYAPLYCFLSGRRHAVRELSFLKVMKIGGVQEGEIIHQLESKQVPLVVITDKIRSWEPEVGRFGETHCKRLAKYIFEHYREVKRWGPWEPDPPKHHAIKFLQRKMETAEKTL